MPKAVLLRPSESTVEVALRYGRAKSRQDIAAALSCCTDDFVLDTVPFGTHASGRAEVEQDLRTFFEQFPDYRFATESYAEGEGSVVLWGHVRMTWSGRIPQQIARPWERLFRLPRRRIELPAVAVLDVRDGLLARERFFFDMRSLCRQMGVPAFVVESLLRRAERLRHRVVDGAVVLRAEESIVIDAPIERVYARAFADVRQLMHANPPWLLPRARRIELVGAPSLRVDAIRRIHLASGHITDERIEEATPPRRIRYRVINGWGPPLDAVIACTRGEHELEPLLDGRTLVTWRGYVTPRTALARPIAHLLIATVLRPMLRRFLRALPGLVSEEFAR